MALLELKKITRRFGPVVANDEVDFDAAAGKIHALVGENGAGKSTLMHVAFGLLRADGGEIRIAGETVPKNYSPQMAMKRRVGMVHQHFMLAEDMTVAENVILGREPKKGGLLDLDQAAKEIRDVAKEYGLAADPDAVIEDLSVGEKQRVEILKALWRGCDVLILDEPTAVLTPAEVEAFFVVLRGLAKSGMAIVIITHKLDEVFAIADEITVMRRGKRVASVTTAESSPEEVAELMVGRAVLLRVEKGAANPGDPILQVSGARMKRSRGDQALDGLSLEVRSGEILGVAGVEGNGQSELIAAICGLRALEAGRVVIGKTDVTTKPVRARRAVGLGLVPEDRHAAGLVLEFSTVENLLLGRTSEFATSLGIDLDRAREYAEKQIKEHDIRPTSPDALARNLSGGNQQKIVIARELDQPGLEILIASQPTRGVDIGAIERIHRQLIEARDDGLGVLLLSAELPELLSLSDRLIVVYRGKVAAELDADALAKPGAAARIGALMTGAATAREEEE